MCVSVATRDVRYIQVHGATRKEHPRNSLGSPIWRPEPYKLISYIAEASKRFDPTQVSVRKESETTNHLPHVWGVRSVGRHSWTLWLRWGRTQGPKNFLRSLLFSCFDVHNIWSWGSPQTHISYRHNTSHRQRLLVIIWLQEATAYDRIRKDDKLRMQQQERLLACCKQNTTYN